MLKITNQEMRRVAREYGLIKIIANPKETSDHVTQTDLKLLEINPGCQTSLHHHLVAESTFFVLQGECQVIDYSGEFCKVIVGEAFVAQPGEAHRIQNIGNTVAHVIEVQSPPYAKWDIVPREKKIPQNTDLRPIGRFWDATDLKKVKICGIRCPEIALLCHEIGVHAVGINLTKKSKGRKLLSQWVQWIKTIPRELSLFILTDNYLKEELEIMIEQTECDTIQLQGPIEKSLLEETSSFLKGKGLKVVKSVALPEKLEEISGFLDSCGELLGFVDKILLDSCWRGGSGKLGNLEIAANVIQKFGSNVILAGGLNPENIKDVLKKTQALSVDVESGVERKFLTEGRTLSVKSPARILKFFEEVQK